MYSIALHNICGHECSSNFPVFSIHVASSKACCVQSAGVLETATNCCLTVKDDDDDDDDDDDE